MNITDLGILATNWQGTNKLFNQGDLNYDGNVDITDLGMLATKWQANLPPAGQRPTAGDSTPDRSGSKKTARLVNELALVADLTV